MSENADNINYKSIRCTEIPELFLDKLVAKKHFSRFGKITRFILYPQRLSCTIEYETEDAAERALMDGGDYNGHGFNIDYAVREVGHVHTTEEWVDPDVQSELEAMGGSPKANTLQMRGMMPAALKLLPTAVRPAKAGPVQKLLGKIVEAPSAVVTTATPKIDSAVRSELEAILRRPALTEEEKYRVLDARDKLIRLTTVRQTDIKKAVSTRGTCPDMCPEKERLMREFQRQVSSFEMEDSPTTSSISHRRAIKEYSRSSADQEVPLPHELRSEAVLQMTMLYLMHHIMDLCDDPQISIADWFHFVWDRTRSIRKDITQQELCSVGVVELVEQCARFHIHCAARLVAEEPSVFDKKINTENLTKCLQTLKYMYHDLRIKNEVCPNEAEFRGYIILLNLGDANFLWEVKQLPGHIQNSNAIRRAIAFYNALQNNNYVRFFDMVRSPETSYMNACILLSYFNKLRFRAMEVIYKAHNWRKTSTVFPLSHLTKVFGFEDELSAADFLQYHGWQCDEDRVVLDSVKRPDVEYTMDRAMLLVESKRTVSVGECVCGHQLDSPAILEAHEPHNSFDSNGYLRADSWAAGDQLRGDADSRNKSPHRFVAPSPPPAASQRKASPTPAQPAASVEPSNAKSAAGGLFKIPFASPPPISLKQQQQQQQQKSMPASLFNGNGPTPSGNNSELTPTFNATPTGQSFFKASMAEVQRPSSPPPPPSSSSSPFANIFSTAAKETKNMFQTLVPQNQQIFAQPTPVHSNNLFQSAAAGSGAVAALPAEFAGNAQQNAQYELMEARRREQVELAMQIAQAEKRKRELEEEQRSKQMQLQAERQRLQLLEEERARMHKAKVAEAKRQQKLKELHQMAEQLTSAVLGEVLTSEIEIFASGELCRYQKFDRDCEELQRLILQDEILANVAAIANEEFAVMCRDQMILRKYLTRWMAYTRKRIEQRALIASLPKWATRDSRAQLTEKLEHPNVHSNLQMIKRYRHGQPCDFGMLLGPGDAHSSSAATATVDIFEIFRQHCRSRKHDASVQSIKYVKLVLTLPAETDELPGFESLCNKWLRKCLRLPPPPLPQSEAQSPAFINQLDGNVALCVRKVSCVAPVNEQGQRVRDECANANALVVFMSCTNVQNTQRRLHQLLSRGNINRGVPVAFVVYNAETCDGSLLARALELQLLVAEGKIGAYKFYGCCESKSDFNFNGHFARALRFAARNVSMDSEMRVQSLQSWLEATLGEEMWRRWQQSTVENPVFAKLCMMPQHVIALHNEAVNRLHSMVVLKDWRAQPDFPTELREIVPHYSDVDLPRGLEAFPPDWKCPSRQENLSDFLNQLKLPPCDCGEDDALPTDVEGWELWFLNYASVCLPNDDIAATEAAYEAIKVFIELVNSSNEVSTAYECSPPISFLLVIKKLVFSCINYVLQHSPVAKKAPKELFYQRADIVAYCEQPWWLNIKPIESVTIDYSQEQYGVGDEAAGGATVDVAEQEEKQIEEMQEVLHNAEQLSRRVENTFHVLKQQMNNSIRCNALRRELDESFYHFEVSKSIGIYNEPVINEFEEMEKAEEQENKSPHRSIEKPMSAAADKSSDNNRKRKHAHDEDEVSVVLAKALDLIERVEAKQDERRRLRLDDKFFTLTN